MRSFVRDQSLTIVLIAIFLASFLGQILTGYRANNAELVAHGASALTFGSYLTSGHLMEATFENWESEFLQMGMYVLLTAYLFQRGSAESRDPDAPEEAHSSGEGPDVPALARKGGIVLWFYEHSLAIAFLLLFAGSFVLHLWGGTSAENAELDAHGEPSISMLDFLGSSQFWFQSFQNWQSEFLAVTSIVLLSIVLRERNSPQSKPVEAPHRQTGA